MARELYARTGLLNTPVWKPMARKNSENARQWRTSHSNGSDVSNCVQAEEVPRYRHEMFTSQ